MHCKVIRDGFMYLNTIGFGKPDDTVYNVHNVLCNIIHLHEFRKNQFS